MDQNPLEDVEHCFVEVAAIRCLCLGAVQGQIQTAIGY